MKLTLEIKPTIAQLAEAFCELDDESQAQFFIECGRIALGWEIPQCMQWHAVGKHLRICACSTHEAREMVSSIAAGAERQQCGTVAA